ncbi:uncharacterized protein LOC131429203 [Malaya genurostris]|uniref:uncharacterized protein LOC131429203 n=1 Tax=Malaya genurostris TaxID=325434 RepID=UPI0026F3C34C|nr:uncharacterized protein LOC131429203 [Malaya genurostris]
MSKINTSSETASKWDKNSIRYGKLLLPVNTFFGVFFSQGALHGITYLGKSLLHLGEKFMWICLIIVSLYFCITLSLESLERFQTKSTVVTIEKDHYYWNISMPSLTICPMNRISRAAFRDFCLRNNLLDPLEQDELFDFVESLANSTYLNFQNIKGSQNIDRILSMLRIYPKDYMTWITNLTEDLTQRDHQELRVRNQNNLEFIRTLQTLTEYGICYTTNSFIAPNLTTSDTSVTQRGCRFHFESNLTHYSIYTKEICRQECRLQLAYHSCGCIPHFYPNNIKQAKPVCNYKTLINCFPPRKELFLEFHSGQETVQCFCEPNCVDSKVIIEKVQILIGTRKLLGSNGGLVIMKRYPLIRFSRQVLFSFTDLLVSIGGTAGFFLGFNVLGIVEIIYFFTLRLLWYILGRR